MLLVSYSMKPIHYKVMFMNCINYPVDLINYIGNRGNN